MKTLTKQLWHGVALGVLVIAASVTSATPVNAQVPDTGATIARVMQKLNDFRSTHSFKDLQVAINTLELVSADTYTSRPEINTMRRRLAAHAWAAIFHEIDAESDPKFDPNDLSQLGFLCVPPPPGYPPPCANPAIIAEPKLRAEYEEANRINHEKALRGNFQVRLQNANQSAMATAEAVFQSFRQHTPPDREAIDRIFKDSGMAATRRAQLDAWLQGDSNSCELHRNVLGTASRSVC